MGGGKKLVIGVNHKVKEYDGRPSVHAEFSAMQKYLKIRNPPKKIDLLVVRMSTSGVLGSSRPCPHCIKNLIRKSKKHNIQIKRVYYSNDDGTITIENFQDMPHHESTYVSTGFRARTTVNA